MQKVAYRTTATLREAVDILSGIREVREFVFDDPFIQEGNAGYRTDVQSAMHALACRAFESNAQTAQLHVTNGYVNYTEPPFIPGGGICWGVNDGHLTGDFLRWIRSAPGSGVDAISCELQNLLNRMYFGSAGCGSLIIQHRSLVFTGIRVHLALWGTPWRDFTPKAKFVPPNLWQMVLQLLPLESEPFVPDGWIVKERDRVPEWLLSRVRVVSPASGVTSTLQIDPIGAR